MAQLHGAHQPFATFDCKLAENWLLDLLSFKVVPLALHCFLPPLHCVPIDTRLIAFVCVKGLMDNQSADGVCHIITAVGVFGGESSVLCMNHDDDRV